MPNRLRKHRIDSPGRVDETARRKSNSNDAQLRAIRIRNSARWQRLRSRKLKADPLCVDPFQVHAPRVVPATDVHHIVGLSQNPRLAFTWSNLASLCSRCHGRVEGLARTGSATKGLFEPGRGGKSLAHKAPTPTAKCKNFRREMGQNVEKA